ncbi:kinase-like domain-containing protein [Alternaria alternata]|nr:kinase-like domain-containing protein [Alternaria alternata]
MDSLFSDVMNDWSGTGRGCHVDFGADEVIPLQTGDLLGQGADAIVHETTVKGFKVAWKRSSRHKQSKESIRLEVEVLKKLSHRHLVRLIGSYTHKRYVGLLLHPVAVCDLGTFFEDAEAHLQDNATDDQELRLRQLGYPASRLYLKHKAWPIYSQIGCLLSAVAYLHSQSIRHKDIKPSNILLSQGRLWLSDFGLARDFSDLVESGSDGGAGTARYKAPEVADLELSGRASDMFSLGCVLLETMVFDQDGSLKRLRPESSTTRFVYHDSLDKIKDWLPWPEELSPVKHHLCIVIRSLLSRFPKQRLGAEEVVSRISLCENMVEDVHDRIFSDCCRTSYFTERHFQSRIKALQIQILDLRREKQNEQQILQTDRQINDLEAQDWTDSGIWREARQWIFTVSHL